jgi:putative ABC transport system substrate-binding protein
MLPALPHLLGVDSHGRVTWQSVGEKSYSYFVAWRPPAAPHVPSRRGASPLSAFWRIGRGYIDTFREALNDLGYVNGKNVRFERSYAMGRSDRLPGLAADLVNSKVDVILSVGTDAALAAKRATTTIPIVMGGVGDPVASDIVSNLARPESNITGFSSQVQGADFEAKRLELLKEMVPTLSRAAIFTNPNNPYERLALERIRRDADMLRVSLALYEVHDMTTLASALGEQLKARPDALIVLGDAFLYNQRVRIAQFAIENKLPSISPYREYVDAGGLITYTTNVDDLIRRVASYVAKILKGTKPADLPVQQPTKFDLVINLKTAKALGITVPPALLARANEVIE